MIPKHHITFSSEELNHFIKIAVIVCIGMLTIFLLAETVNQAKTYSVIGEQPSSQSQQNTITVTASSDMDAKPDITTFSWSVDTNGKTPEEAQNAAATIANKALAYLQGKGIADADLKTTGFSTNTHYDNKPVPCVLQTRGAAAASPVAVSAIAPAGVSSASESGSAIAAPLIIQGCGGITSVASGYDTYESVDVTVRNIVANPSLAGELIAGLGALGVKPGNPVSTLENQDAYQDQVRGQAIEKARQKALLLASQLGVRIGSVVSFNEDSAPAYPMAFSMGEAKLAGAPVAPELPTGTNKITSNVTIVYQIQ